MKIENRINEKLNERKWYHRVTAITLVLSLICSFLIPLDLIKPGVAMTLNNDMLGTTVLATAGNEWFDDVQTTPLGDNLSGKITSLSITSGGKTYDGTPIMIDAKDADPLMFKMQLSYNYDGEQLKSSGILDSHCVYYRIPENTVKVRQSYFGSGMKVIDSSWNKEVPSGYYSISEDGLVVIRFTDGYIKHLRSSSNGFRGAIEFNAKAERADNADGDRSFKIEGTEIEIKFDDEVPTMSKDGRAIVDEDGRLCIQWTITINNPKGHIDLSEYTLTDEVRDDSSNVDWSQITDWSVNPKGAAEKSENGFTLSGKAQQVIITYNEFVQSGHNYKNTAKLQKGDNQPITSEKEVLIENALEASKSGKPDYELIGKGEGNKIQWTIDVSNKAGESLDKTKITDDNFPDDLTNITVYAFDANNQKTVLSEGKDLSDHVLTLTGANIPSHVQIVYETEVDKDEKGIPVYNSCTVESEKENPPTPDNDNTASVTYEHQYRMEKSCLQFNTETDMLQWKIQVWAGDGKGSATLDGYKIKDDAIENLNYVNNGNNENQISFKAYTNGEAVNITDRVELVKKQDSKEITVKLKNNEDTTTISMIEVFYQQTVENNLNDAEKYAEYQSGKDTKVSNEAFGEMPGTGISEHDVGDKTEHKVVDANKSYLSASDESVIGNADKKDRILEWKIEVKNDGGIGKDSRTLTDILTNDHGGKHFIKPSQISNIKITGKSTENGELINIESSGYTIKFYDASDNEILNFADSDKEAVKFEVVFNDKLNDIRRLYIEYKTTADVSNVENGNISHFDNKLTYEGSPKTTTGLTFKREDPNDVKKINLSVNKTWDDRNDRAKKRPESYKIQVWQAEADENGNPPEVTNKEAWKKIGDSIQINSNTQGDYLLGKEYPQWVVKEEENGTEIVVRYCYRITEENDSGSGYYVSSISEPFVAKNDSQTMRLTNKLDAETDKAAIDKDGREINDIDLSKVTKVTFSVGGIDTECYIFGWMVYLKDYDQINKENNRYTDTMPSNAIYINGDVRGDWRYSPKVIYGENDTRDLGEMLVTSVSGNTLKFEVKDDKIRAFRYFTAIPKNQIDAALQSGLLINTVKPDNQEKEYQAILEVNKDIADDTKYLEKGNIPVIVGGVAKYYLDINPTGKKLSNEDYINITDELYYHQDSIKKNLKIVLDDIKVYPYENGIVNKLAPIQDFSYTVDYDYSETNNLTYSESHQTSDGKRFWYIEGWKPGQTITINTQQNNEVTDKIIKPYVYVYSGDVNSNNLAENKLTDEESNWGNPRQFSDYNDDGKSTVTFTISQNAKKIIVVSEPQEIKKIQTHKGYLVDEIVLSGTPGLSLSEPAIGKLNGNDVRYWEVKGWQYDTQITIESNINELLAASGKKVYYYMYYGDINSSDLTVNKQAGTGMKYNGVVSYYAFGSEKSVGKQDKSFKDSIVIPNPDPSITFWGSSTNPVIKHIIVACDYASVDEEYSETAYPTNGIFNGVSRSPSVPVLLNVSVPDQQHYRIEYSYRVTGYTPDTSEENEQSNGDIIFFNNRAHFEADNGVGKDNLDKVQLNVKSSGATSEATKFPKIYKVDVNNYSLNNLNASFKVAKWVQIGENEGKWVYASKIENVESNGKTIRKFTFPESGNEETVSDAKHYAPDGAAVLKFAKEDDESTENDSENLHEFNLDSATLYKFVEIEAPEDYKQPIINGSLEENKEFVYYYAYNGYTGDEPEDAKDNNGRSLVRNIVENGTVNIPNSKDVTLKVQKLFTGKEEDLPDKADVTLKLYYSMSRAGTNLNFVKEDMLVDSTVAFDNPITLKYEKGKTELIAEWTQLPSGINGIPIYYFVQEEEVVIQKTENGHPETKTYTLDTESGKLKSGDDVCPFQPVYTRNGTNQDGTVIQVNNSEGILVKKTWLNASGRIVSPPKEPNSNESMKINFEVYGILNGYRVKIDLRDETSREDNSPQPTLNGDNGYKLLLPNPVGLLNVTSNSIRTAIGYTDGKTYSLSEFTSFDIEEKLTSEQIQDMYGKFGNPQTTRMVQNGIGVLEMINTDLRSDTVDVDVTKLWDDDNKSHTSDSVTVKLIQSTKSSLSAEQLDKSQDSIVESTSKVKIILKNVSQDFSYSKQIKSVTTKDEGWNCTIDSSDKTKFKLDGHVVGSTVLTVTFEDDSTEEIIVSVVDSYTEVLNNDNNWQYKWEKLPAVSDDGETYYYYVFEESVPEGYEAVYSKTITNDEQSLTVTNRLPTKLTIEKKWYDASGKEIDTSDNAAIPDKIRVEVYQRPLTEEIAVVKQDAELAEKPTNLKIVAIGDSITLGSYNAIAQEYRYPDRLQAKLLSGNYQNATVQNQGVNSEEISDMINRLDKIDFTGVDAVTLLAGTNDVMHGKSEGAADRYKQLLEAIFAKAQAAGREKFTIYAATIPYITRLDWFQYPDTNPTQERANELVDAYNTAITSIINGSLTKKDSYEIRLVDVNSVVKVIDENGAELDASELMLKDKCHPNEKGYEAIAAAFYNKILYGNTSVTFETYTYPTVQSLPNDKYNINDLAKGTLYGTYNIEKSDNFRLDLKNLPKENALGQKYVYYIREVGTHVLNENGDSYRLSEGSYKYIAGVQYVDNGITPTATPKVITVKNTIQTTQLNIVKDWSDGNANHTADSIKVRIHRDAVADSAAAQNNPLTLTLSKSEVTVYRGYAGHGETLTASVPVKPLTDAMLDVVLDSSGKKILVRSKADSEELTVTAGDKKLVFETSDGQRAELTVHIEEKPALTLELDKYSVIGGQDTPVVKCVKTIDDTEVKEQAMYSSNNSDVIMIDENDGKMTVVGVGTATIKAMYDGKTAEKDVNVSYSDDFTIADALNITAGTEVSLGIDPYFGTFTYLVTPTGDSPSDGLTAENGKVNAIKAGTYTVTVMRHDDEDESKWTSRTVEVNVAIGNKTGTLETGITYSYDASAGIISISISSEAIRDNGNYRFNSIKENLDLKDLIPIKYELIPSSDSNKMAVYGSGVSWSEKEYISSASHLIHEVPYNTIKISEVTGDFGIWDANEAGPYSLKIYVKGSSSGGGNGDSVTFNVNKKFDYIWEGYKYFLDTPQNIAAGSTVTVTLSNAEPGKLLQIALYEDSDPHIASASGYSDGEGVVTLTFTVNESRTLKRFDFWDYLSNGWNSDQMEKSNIVIESYTITPPANSNSANKASKLTRFTTSSLRMSSAMKLAGQMNLGLLSMQLDMPEDENTQFQKDGYIDITIDASDNWQITLSDLPMYYIKNGVVEPYYYWVEETDVKFGYITSYSFTDADENTDYSINASKSGEAAIRITNTLDQIFDSVTLPESGGKGTEVYYIIGGMMLLLSAAGYIMNKRRRWSIEQTSDTK